MATVAMIRIVRDGVVVFESESLYDADWLYYEEQEVKELGSNPKRGGA